MVLTYSLYVIVSYVKWVILHETWQLQISYKLHKSHSMMVVMYSAVFQTWLTTLMKNKY